MALWICKQHLHPPALPPPPSPTNRIRKHILPLDEREEHKCPHHHFERKCRIQECSAPQPCWIWRSHLFLSPPPTLFFPLSSWLQMDPSPSLIFFFFFCSGSPPSLPGPVSGMIHCAQLRELICRGAEIRSAQALCRYNQKTSAQAAGSSFPIQGNNITGRKEQEKHTHTYRHSQNKNSQGKEKHIHMHISTELLTYMQKKNLKQQWKE